MSSFRIFTSGLLTMLRDAGHDLAGTPIAFFNFVLRKEPSYTDVKDFENDVKNIANIIAADGDGNDRDYIQEIVGGLWLGEMTWREFVDYLRQRWDLDDEACQPWEKKGMDLIHFMLHLTFNGLLF